MSKFSSLEVMVDGTPVTYLPYDRGQNNAFVFRKEGSAVFSRRLLVTTNVDDNSSDRYKLQVNNPVVCATDDECFQDKLLGTDLVKLEMRFLASTSKQDRAELLDTLIGALDELRGTFEDRDVMYS